MKHLICLFTLLALLAATATAQDEEIEIDGLQERIQELVRKATSGDPAEREAALAELKKLADKKADVGKGIQVRTVKGDMQLRFEVDSDAGEEKIRGTWNDKGTKGQYTLTSKGKGRYVLVALSVDADGTKSEYTDEGSLEELRKKYPFLRSFSAVFIGPGATAGSVTGAKWNAVSAWPTTVLKERVYSLTTSVPALGITVRRPSKELEFHLKLPTETTWIVESVTAGGKGASLGLKRFDLITSADGTDLDEVAPLLKANKTLAIVRRSKPMRIALAAEEPK